MNISELNGKYKVVGSAQALGSSTVPKKDLLGKTTDVVTSIFPGKKVGETLGTAFVAGQQYLKGNSDIARNIAATAPKPIQVAGDVAAGAATIAGFKGVGTTGGVLKKALESAGLGAVISGGRSAAEGSSASEVTKDAAIGGAIGGGTSLALSGAEAILNGVKKLPQRLIKSATGQTTKDIIGGKDISNFVLENKKIGTADMLIRQSQSQIDKADEIINNALTTSSNTFDDAAVATVNRHLQEARDVVATKSPNFEKLGGTQGLISSLKENIVSGLNAEGKESAAKAIASLSGEGFDSVDSFAKAAIDRVKVSNGVPVKDIVDDIAASINAGGGEATDASVRATLKRLAPQVSKTLDSEYLSLKDANALRSKIDKVLGDKAFLSTQVNSYDKGILLDFANAIREQVKGRAPEGTRAAFNTLSKEITLRNLLEKKIAQGSRNQIIGLGDLITGTGGLAVGGPVGGLGLAAGKRIVESTPFKTGTAVLIDQLDQKLTPILQSLESSIQTSILNAFAQAVAESGAQTNPQP